MAADANLLGEYLAARRARVRPDDVGIPVLGRRRVPGLRREELAQLAGVSVDYYVRLEQGRARHPSPEVLDALARALRLDDLERRHLHELGASERARPRHRTPSREEARTALTWLLDAFRDVPALVMGRRMDVLAWNRLAAALVGDFGAMSPRERNLARHVFLDPAARDVYVEWEVVAHDTVGVLRRAAAQYPDDEELEALIGELSVKSPQFARWWAGADVHEKTFGSKRYAHPVVGELELRFETFTLPGDPGQTLLTYVAEPGSPSETALRLLAQLAAEADASPAGAARAEE
jgi:transcriptional regulator with XRE-family HTH domain